MAGGATWIAPLSRKNSVPTTASSPTASRRSWASSSVPGASGTGRVLRLRDVDGRALVRGGADQALALVGQDLDRALGAVALAPAEARVAVDHRAQLQDPVHQGLGPRRAARDVDVDRQELVGRDDRVVVEDAHRGAAGAHRDRE